MEENDFLNNFSLQFDETDPSSINLSTNFKDLDEWSSLTALSLIAMVDEEYTVKVTAEDFRNANSVRDLYQLVKGRL